MNIYPELYIGTDKLNRVETFKYLGLNIDSTLKFQTHINATKSKLSRICGASYRLRRHLNLSAARKLYYSGFYATIQYCICAYGGLLLCTQRGERLLKLQNRTMKNLFSRFYPDSRDLYKDTSILKLPDVYKLRVGIYMYRCLVLDDSPAVKRSLILTQSDHSYDTRGALDLIPPYPRVETIRINFQHQFINVWNEIPSRVKEQLSLKNFKRSLMNHMIDSY